MMERVDMGEGILWRDFVGFYFILLGISKSPKVYFLWDLPMTILNGQGVDMMIGVGVEGVEPTICGKQ